MTEPTQEAYSIEAYLRVDSDMHDRALIIQAALDKARADARADTAKDAEIARLREALKSCDLARIVLDLVEELNPSNYDHDGVCNLNAAFAEAWVILDSIDFQALGASHDA